MASKNNEKPETIRAVQRAQNISRDSDGGGTSSSRSSTSSWLGPNAVSYFTLIWVDSCPLSSSIGVVAFDVSQKLHFFCHNPKNMEFLVILNSLHKTH